MGNAGGLFQRALFILTFAFNMRVYTEGSSPSLSCAQTERNLNSLLKRSVKLIKERGNKNVRRSMCLKGKVHNLL